MMVHIFREYGYGLLFAAILAETLGLPIPSYPLALLAAAIAADLQLSLGGILIVGVVAALLGDMTWYLIGRRRGRPILRTLCSISLNPDSCVSRTETFFARHGLKSLLVTKFFPGLNTVVQPIAGMLRISALRFVPFDLGGIVLWIGSAVTLGVFFRGQVEWLLAWLDALGRFGLLMVGGSFAGWVLFKWVERRRFYRLLTRSRISSPELKALLDRGELVAIVDLRSGLGYQEGGVKIRGSLHIRPEEFEARYKEIPPGRPIVMYCT
jgi:membrane protein DedA with SNARE-associated domain